MKMKFGAFSNSNLVLVSFGFTHKQLLTAAHVDSNALRLESDDGKRLLFRMDNTQNTSADRLGVSFPFVNQNEDANVTVAFQLKGNDLDLVRADAGTIKASLEQIEKQVLDVIKGLDSLGKSIEDLSFGDK